MQTCIYIAATVRREHYGSLIWYRYSAKVTRQHDTTLMTKCSMASDKTRCAHAIEDIIRYS
jgi:hypothetical protein